MLGCSSQLRGGRLTRRPVSCVESGTVKKSVGKGPISGLEGSNWTTTSAVSRVWNPRTRRAEYRIIFGLKNEHYDIQTRDFSKDLRTPPWRDRTRFRSR